MRNGAVVAPAAVTKETDIGDVVLPAGVEAAADLYLQVLDRLRQDGILRRQAGAAPASPRDEAIPLAGIRARAGGNIDDRMPPRLGEADGF